MPQPMGKSHEVHSWVMPCLDEIVRCWAEMTHRRHMVREVSWNLMRWAIVRFCIINTSMPLQLCACVCSILWLCGFNAADVRVLPSPRYGESQLLAANVFLTSSLSENTTTIPPKLNRLDLMSNMTREYEGYLFFVGTRSLSVYFSWVPSCVSSAFEGRGWTHETWMSMDNNKNWEG